MLSLVLAAGLAFDHSRFDALLARHVTPKGLVDYDAFARAPAFAEYLASFDRARPEAMAPKEQLAFWINAYNAWTIALVNRHGERESIRNINRTLGVYRGKGPWQEPIARVGGKMLTLDEIEHGIVRRRFVEPRIHFALVCAARGCPPLRREAYRADRLDAQLDDQARAFVLRSPDRNRVDLAARTVHLSPIFAWYREDFGGDDAAIGRYLARFFPAGPERALLESGRFTLRTTEYDWSLNRAP